MFKTICAYIPPDTSYRGLRFVGMSLGFWPLKKSSEKWFLKLDYWFWFPILNYVLIMMPLCYGFYLNWNNIVALSYSWLEVTGYIEAIAVLIFSKYKRPRLQALLTTTEEQLDISKVPIVMQYANFYAKLYISMLSCYTLVIMIYLILDKPKTEYETFLMSAIYPFDIDSKITKILLYFNQIFTLSYASIIPNFDGIAVFLIFTLTDQLRLLEYNLKRVKYYTELVYCIQEHQNILCLLEETNDVVRFIVLKTVLSFMSCAIASGLQILNNTALSQCIHQISIMTLVYVRLYLCSESAEHMQLAATDLAHSIYATTWYDETPEVITMKLIIMQRCQKPPVITVNGFMSELNRRYLGTILYATFSYLMTLRTIVGSKY